MLGNLPSINVLGGSILKGKLSKGLIQSASLCATEPVKQQEPQAIPAQSNNTDQKGRTSEMHRSNLTLLLYLSKGSR